MSKSTNNIQKCKDCEFCRPGGRQKAKYSCLKNSRRSYHCDHPERLKYTKNDFIGFGDTTLESPLQLKSSKRWCPLRQEE